MSNIIWQGPISRYRNMYSVYSSPMPAISTSCYGQAHTLLALKYFFWFIDFCVPVQGNILIGYMFRWSKFSIMIHLSVLLVLYLLTDSSREQTLIFPKNTSVCVEFPKTRQSAWKHKVGRWLSSSFARSFMQWRRTQASPASRTARNVRSPVTTWLRFSSRRPGRNARCCARTTSVASPSTSLALRVGVPDIPQ